MICATLCIHVGAFFPGKRIHTFYQIFQEICDEKKKDPFSFETVVPRFGPTLITCTRRCLPTIVPKQVSVLLQFFWAGKNLRASLQGSLTAQIQAFRCFSGPSGHPFLFSRVGFVSTRLVFWMNLQLPSLNKRRPPDLWRNSFAGHPSLCQIPENMKHQCILCGSPHLRADCVGTQLNRSSISIRHPVQISREEGGRGRAVLGGRVEGVFDGIAGSLKSPPLCPLPFHPCLPYPLWLPPTATRDSPLLPHNGGEAGGRGRGERPRVERTPDRRDQCRENQRRAGYAVCFPHRASPRITKTPWSLWPVQARGSSRPILHSLPESELRSDALCYVVLQVSAVFPVPRTVPGT